VSTEEDEVVEDEVVKEEEKKLEAIKAQEGLAHWLFHKLFYFNIFKKIRLGEVTKQNFWTDRAPPVPLSLQQALQLNQPNESTSNDTLPDQRLWSIKENAEKFLKRYWC
jgi:hypothetical protein